jgi:beta-glucosidase
VLKNVCFRADSPKPDGGSGCRSEKNRKRRHRGKDATRNAATQKGSLVVNKSILLKNLLPLAPIIAGLLLPLSSLAASASKQKAFTSFDGRAKEWLAKMTLEEKVGQMCQPDQAFLKDPSDIEKYFLGSLLSGGGSGPKNKEEYTLKGWTDMVDGFQQHAIKTRLGIPLIYGVDAVHGHNNIPGAVIFPHNIGLGCARNANLVEKIERITAEEVRATGINWAFAPCVAAPQDAR